MMRKILFAALCLTMFPLQGYALQPSEKLLFEKNSLYQYISVVEDTVKKERYIRNYRRELSQGGISLNAPEALLLEYTQMAFVAVAFMDREPKDVLFVGLGAGAMPKYLNRHYPEVNIDIAEIDPDVVPVAEKFFYFRENEKMKVHVDDGRLFIKRTKKKYDMIFLDAYQNDYIPFHLTTAEFLREVKGRLKEGGVVASNVLSTFRNKFFDSMVMTYRQVFPHLYIFKGRRSNNFILVATVSGALKEQDCIEAKAAAIRKARKFDIDLEGIAARYEYSTEYEVKSAKILTDDFAPVNLYKFQESGAR